MDNPKNTGPAVNVGKVALADAGHSEFEKFQPFQFDADYNFHHLTDVHQKLVLKMIHDRLEKVTNLPENRTLYFMNPGPQAEAVVTNYPYLHLEIDDTLYEVLETAVYQHGYGGLFSVLYDSLLQAFPARLVIRIMHEQRLEWPDQTEDLVMPAPASEYFSFPTHPATQEGE